MQSSTHWVTDHRSPCETIFQYEEEDDEEEEEEEVVEVVEVEEVSIGSQAAVFLCLISPASIQYMQQISLQHGGEKPSMFNFSAGDCGLT